MSLHRLGRDAGTTLGGTGAAGFPAVHVDRDGAIGRSLRVEPR